MTLVVVKIKIRSQHMLAMKPVGAHASVATTSFHYAGALKIMVAVAFTVLRESTVTTQPTGLEFSAYRVHWAKLPVSARYHVPHAHTES